VTRAARAGAQRLVVPTAGNAGVALAAYAARRRPRGAGVRAGTTPPTILGQIRSFGGDLVLVDGHIGDCGAAARAYATETGALDVSTLREPYRIEGKKTLGLELAEQLGWTLPDAIVYPHRWRHRTDRHVEGVRRAHPRRLAPRKAAPPLQRAGRGCAPVVRGFEAGTPGCAPWPDPRTIAAGLRVPAPLGDRLMLRALRESGGGAVAVPDELLGAAARDLQTLEGIDAAPEGGASLAGAIELKARGCSTLTIGS